MGFWFVVGMESMRHARRAIATLMALCLALAPVPLLAAHLPPVMSQAQLADRMTDEQAPPLIDVRTPGEYRSGHIPGAINIPIQDFQRRFAELGAYRDREVVLYCETGARAMYGGHWLKSQGFEELRFLDGHMGAWRKAGLPSEH
jgi:rhodanese-related sulfurtransferase